MTTSKLPANFQRLVAMLTAMEISSRYGGSDRDSFDRALASPAGEFEAIVAVAYEKARARMDEAREQNNKKWSNDVAAKHVLSILFGEAA